MVSEEEMIDLALKHITEFKKVADDATNVEKSLRNFKRRKGKNLLEVLDSADKFFSTIESQIKTTQSDYPAKLKEFKIAKKQDEAKSAKKQGEAKSAKKQDEAKSAKKQDEAKSAKNPDETRAESPKPKKKEKRNKMKLESEKDEEVTPVKEEDNNKPKIRLVALDKLMDPSVKKSVSFDNSVIILTSSDEENSTPRKAKEHNGKLKSAMKKSPVSPAVKRIRSSDDEGSDTQSKRRKTQESKRSSSRLKKLEEAVVERKRSLKIILTRTKDTNFSVTTNREKRSESSNSSSNEDEGEEKESTKKSIEQDDETDTTPPKVKSLRPRTKKQGVLKDITSSSSSDEESSKSNDTKPSSDSHSSSSSDEDLSHLNQKKQKKKDKDTESTQSLELRLSSSDESASSTASATKEKETKSASTDDEKFTWKVYIPLPTIKCSKLKKYHEKKLEEMRFKRLTSLKDLLRPFSPRLSKAKSKKSKGTKKKQLPKEDESEVESNGSSSGNELNNENKSSNPVVDEQVLDHHKMAAEMLMDDLQEDDNKQAEETDKDEQKDSESETAGDEPAITTDDAVDSDKSQELSEPEESSNKANDAVPEKEKSPGEANHEISAEKEEASKEAAEGNSEKDKSSDEADNEEGPEETQPRASNESDEPEKEEDKTTTERTEAEQGKKDQVIEEPDKAEQVTEADIFQMPAKSADQNSDSDITDIDEALYEEGNPDDIEERMRRLTESPSYFAGKARRSKAAQRETTPEKVTSDATKEPEEVPEDKEVNSDESGEEITKTTEEETALEKKDGEDVPESVKETNHESASEDNDEKAKESIVGASVVVIPDSDDETDQKSDNETKKESTEVKKESDSNSDDEEDSNSAKKKAWKKDKLLTEKIDSSDSDDDFTTKNKKKVKVSDSKKSKRKRTVISDSDDSDKSKSKSESEDDKDDSAESSDGNSKKKNTRKRIRRARDSSSEEEEVSTRKHIRKVLDKNSLSESTLKAENEEKQRKARIAEKQKKYNNVFEEKTDAKIDKLVLEWSKDKKEELLAVDQRIVKKLKPHQANGIQFMWDACFESLEMAKNDKGSGCIVAHCMGLGKTLQVIALTHTLIANSRETNVERVLVVCPVSTVLNWKAEFKKWMPNNTPFDVYDLICKSYERKYRMDEWLSDGGVMLIGYSMFRNLSNPSSKTPKKLKEVFQKGFVDPGPDLVICDEGHLLKNEKAGISKAMNRIRTSRRIVLTGTPLQNNLKEYWCMVQFIKPNLLGTYKEYLNRFVNPITNGQYTDSTQQDIVLMRKRSHVLHKLLDGVVQRRDYSVLEPYLPPKYEYVVFVKLTDVQVKLYKHYMEKLARHQSNSGSNKSASLFADFQALQRICTHPRVLLDKSLERREKDYEDEDESEGSLKDFIDDGSGSGTSTDSDSGDEDEDKQTKKGRGQRARVTRAQAAQKAENGEESDPETSIEGPKGEWWQQYCDGDELDNVNLSGKLNLLFHILKECEEIGDKVLVFSQSLYALNCIEYFLERIDEATRNAETEKIGGFKGQWTRGLDYFRLDGSSSCDNRAIRCDAFNNPNNTRARLFLISTRAGGLGINLYAANRVIIFDASWNPSHDIQSIYRVYRFGQKKPCYIYRFVTYGAMEMKVYERQVTKQAISKRVIDEQQIDRHYNQTDLMELYQCDLEPEERPIPMVPKDVLLGEMLQFHDKVIHKYHIHQSLLENKQEECLNEEERKAAWEEFENEKVLRKSVSSYTMNTNPGITNANMIHVAMMNIVRRDNPQWTMQQVRNVIPAMVAQLQAQMGMNNMALYTMIQKEIYQMQVEKMQNQYKAQQNLLQLQRNHNQLGGLYANQAGPSIQNRPAPSVLATRPAPSVLANRLAPNVPSNRPGPSAQKPMGLAANDVIELND